MGCRYKTCWMKVGIQWAAEAMSERAAVSSVVCAFATITPVNPKQRDHRLSSMSSLRET